MKLLVFMDILPVVSIIGSIVSPELAWPGYQKEIALDVPGGFLLLRSKSCIRTYYSHLVNLATIRIYGMDHYSPTTLKSGILSIYELGSVRMFYIAWVLLYKGLDDKQLKLTQKNRRPLKKIPRMDKGLLYRGMGRGRSSFSKSKHSYSYLGSQREAALCTFCFYSREDRFLRSSKFGNWSTGNSNSSYFQCRDLSSVSLSSAPVYSWAYSSHLGQRQISQSPKVESLFYQAPSSSPTSIFTSVFTRTKPNRASVENHTAKSHTQPLFSKYRKSPRDSCKPVCPMAAP